MSDLPRLQVDNGVAWRSLVCFQHRYNVRGYEAGISRSKRFSPWHPRCHTPVGPVVAQMETSQLRKLIIARENPSSMTHAARTAVAVIVSYLVARLFRLPEAYWAPISTLIVIQSTLGAALPISVPYQRVANRDSPVLRSFVRDCSRPYVLCSVARTAILERVQQLRDKY